MSLDIGYKDKGTFDDYIRSIGIDRNTFELLTTNDYNSFIQKLRNQLTNQNEDHKLTEDDLELLSSWTEEDFYDIQQQAREMHQAFDQSKEDTSDDTSQWKPDYRVLLNGNFDKLDKSALTDEAKKKFDVYGLDDKLYDIYYDAKTGHCLPVYYDYITNNEHWFAFSIYLEKFKDLINIQNLNPSTPLILFDRSLMGIDTNQQLTAIMQVKILQECSINPYFYMRECARVYDKTIGKNVRFQINIADWTFLWLYAQCINTYREQARQSGKSFLLCYAFGMEWSVGTSNCLSLIIHFKSDESAKNRKAMVESVNLLPKFMKLHTIKKSIKKGKEVWEEGPENPVPTEKGKNFWNQRFNNNLKITAVGSTESTASQTGRGDPVRFAAVDELNYIKNATTMLTALQFAHGTARLLAEKAGQRYGLHFASTAGELNTKNGKEMFKLTQEEMCKWDVKLFGYSYEDLRIYLQKNSTKGFFTISYQYDELGFDENWIENAISLATNREEFQKDILSVWQAVDLNALFGVAALTRINQICKENTIVSFMFEKFNRFEYYPDTLDEEFKDYIRKHNAISIGIDIALGTSGDYSVMKCIDLETARPVFQYRENKLNAFDFGILIREFLRYLRKINPEMLICVNIESDGPGQVLIPMLVQEKDIEPMLYRSLEFYNKQMKNTLIKATTKHLDANCYIKYGTAMSKWRGDLTNVLLFDLVDKYPYVFNSPEAFSELTTLKRKQSGKIEHGNGFHDDIIMATLHACAPIFMPKFREHLERYFKFVVDFRKIESLPLDSHIVSYSDIDKNNDVEGKLDWAIITKVDKVTGIEYEELIMSKIMNGRKVVLTPAEVQDELARNEELQAEPRIRMMKLRRYDLLKQRLQEEHVTKEIESVESLSMKNVLNSNDKKEREARNNPLNMVSGRQITGNDLSHDGRRDSGYMKKNYNNYKASLI